MTNRRSFLLGAAALFAAPAIVRADSLMKLWIPHADLVGFVQVNIGGWAKGPDGNYHDFPENWVTIGQRVSQGGWSRILFEKDAPFRSKTREILAATPQRVEVPHGFVIVPPDAHLRSKTGISPRLTPPRFGGPLLA